MKIIHYHYDNYWPLYWEHFVHYYSAKYNILGPLLWTEFITLKLQQYGFDLDDNFDDNSYKVTFPSEEEHFLFKLEWS